MVYESDFYTTRRPYRTTPSLSTYTVSTITVPSRQVRILPGLGKVHVVHTYDRIVPYAGHKRLTVVTTPPPVFRVRPSVLYREFDRIERKVRPDYYYSATNHYLNSDSAVRMIYYRYPYTGVRYYSVIRPPALSTSRWFDLLRRDLYYPYAGYRYYRNFYPETSNYWYDYLSHLYSHTYPVVYRPYSKTFDYSSNFYYPLLGYRYYRYFYPTSNWTNYINTYRRLYDNLYFDSVYRPLKGIFDDETRAIRADTASLLKRIHYPVPRARTPLPIMYSRYDDLSAVPSRLYNDSYIYKTLTSGKSGYTTYYTEPVKKFIGQGHLACITYGGEKGYGRRRTLYTYEDPVKNDIQLLSYYINKFRQDKNLAPREPKEKLEEQPKAEITAE